MHCGPKHTALSYLDSQPALEKIMFKVKKYIERSLTEVPEHWKKTNVNPIFKQRRMKIWGITGQIASPQSLGR